MKKNEFKEKIEKTDDIVKGENGFYLAPKYSIKKFFKKTWTFIKEKLCPILLTGSLYLSAGALAACQPETVEPDPKPPISQTDPSDKPSTPTEPEDPNKQQPETPPEGENPVDPGTQTPVEPDDPKDPDEKNPDEKDPNEKDPDDGPVEPPVTHMTDKELVDAAYQVAKDKIQKVIGKTSTINTIVAMDYENSEDSYNLYFLIDNTSKVSGQKIELVQVPVDNEVNRDNIENNLIKTTKESAQTLIAESFSVFEKDIDKTNKIYNKLNSEGLLESKDSPIVLGFATSGGGIDTTLGCGSTTLSVYEINQRNIEKLVLSVKSDGNTNDFVTDHLINGKLNVSFREYEPSHFYYEFTNNAIFDDNWFNEMKNAKQESENSEF